MSANFGQSSQFKIISHAYGFEDVGIVPGEVTINPDQTDLSVYIGEYKLDIPVLASAMDAVMSPEYAVLMSKMGGLGVLNLEGIYARYEDYHEIIDRIINADASQATILMQEIYAKPIREELIAVRIKQIKDQGAICAVSFTPQNAKKLAPVAVESGADMVVIQATVTTARHLSKSDVGLNFDSLKEVVKIPLLVGNCASYGAAKELMDCGIDGLLVGVGPGAACTTREVVGVGVPQVTATMECAAAREQFYIDSGKYVPIFTDGGIRTGGDLCKSIVSGADGVMIGTPFAQTKEAIGRGFNWGMATPHPDLPRGIRINAGVKGSIKELLFGPSSRTDGTQNLIGALEVGMGMCGAYNIKEMQKADLVIAPSIRTEGKIFQHSV